MEITKMELIEKIKEVEQKAVNMTHGYVGLTPELDVWTYSTAPNPNNCLCGLDAGETKRKDVEWRYLVLGEILEDIKMGEIDIKLV